MGGYFRFPRRRYYSWCPPDLGGYCSSVWWRSHESVPTRMGYTLGDENGRSGSTINETYTHTRKQRTHSLVSCRSKRHDGYDEWMTHMNDGYILYYCNRTNHIPY